jgi:hypothetical protein
MWVVDYLCAPGDANVESKSDAESSSSSSGNLGSSSTSSGGKSSSKKRLRKLRAAADVQDSSREGSIPTAEGVAADILLGEKVLKALEDAEAELGGGGDVGSDAGLGCGDGMGCFLTSELEGSTGLARGENASNLMGQQQWGERGLGQQQQELNMLQQEVQAALAAAALLGDEGGGVLGEQEKSGAGKEGPWQQQQRRIKHARQGKEGGNAAYGTEGGGSLLKSLFQGSQARRSGSGKRSGRAEGGGSGRDNSSKCSSRGSSDESDYSTDEEVLEWLDELPVPPSNAINKQ